MELLLFGTQLYLGLLFVLAGLAKLADRRDFRRAVGKYGILPERWLAPFAAILPWVEVLLGLGVTLSSLAAAPLVLLLAAFAMAMAVNLARGRIVSCGCSGPRAHRSAGAWWLAMPYWLEPRAPWFTRPRQFLLPA